jgi:DNA topoisomerase-2
MAQQKDKYQNMDEISHVLHRPGMYVGAIELEDIKEYVAEIVDDKIIIKHKIINSSSAVLRIFVEALSNAIDNVERSKNTNTPCTKIKVTIDKETGKTTIWNDGLVIPIAKHEDTDDYIHSMCFGMLRTGSNYDDTEDRVVSGLNGFGIKACNIFSKQFSVKGCDPNSKQVLSQNWVNNMRETTGPVIKSVDSSKKGFTEVSWTPDFKYFGLAGYTDDIINLYLRYIIDASFLSKVKIYFNNTPVGVSNLEKYARLYESSVEDSLYISNDDLKAEIVLTPSGGESEIISFVNGVYTKDGGKHTEAWSKAVFGPLSEKLKTKKGPVVTVKDVKPFFRLFVSVTVLRPKFDSQDKRELKGPNVKADELDKKMVDKIKKWDVYSDIEEYLENKLKLTSRKNEKKVKTINIPGYEPATHAGGKKSSDCVLIICEGLSAKAYAVAGIPKGIGDLKGREWFGILPLRGKVLNVRKASLSEIDNNAVMTQLKQALGLRSGVDYTVDANFKTLRYGKIMSLCDADVDGIHIEALVINFFEKLFPSLLKRKDKFVQSMKTPIVRVKQKGKKDILFFDERRFLAFSNENKNVRFEAKYYKGLATTSVKDVPDTFGVKMLEYNMDNDALSNINKAFSEGKLAGQKYTDIRKEWIAGYDEDNSNFSLDDTGVTSNMNISDFVNEELIKYSFDNCERSLPSCIDGLKESQRKVLFAFIKRNLTYTGKSVKVAQLSAYTAEHSNYHHGEANLADVIKKMACDYTGSNNIPLFYRDGQFGTRHEGGKDGGAPRYIFTKFDVLTEYIYRKEDLNVLNYKEEDGDMVEPEYYVPIIPMILVNGQEGIATGWSTSVPSYNPLQLVDCIRMWIEKNGNVNFEDPVTEKFATILPELTPWYRGFKGTIRENGPNRYTTYGVCDKNIKLKGYVISELPVGCWNSKFKETCIKQVKDGIIEDYIEQSTVEDVKIIIRFPKGDNDGDLDSLKLTSSLSTSNMVMFDEECKLKKYDNVYDIIDTFANTRYTCYVKRKEFLIASYRKEYIVLENKCKFISQVVDKTLNIMDISENDVISIMISAGYVSDPYSDKIDDYDYLLRIQMRSFAKEKVEALKKQKNTVHEKLQDIINTSEYETWLSELDEF